MIPYRNIAKELIILLGLSTAIALTVNYFSPNGIALIGQWDVARGAITANPKDDGVLRELEIQDVQTAKRIFDEGKAVFVDARTQEIYKDGHIKGAVSLPVHRFDERLEGFEKQYPPSTPLVTYCSGKECNDSHRLAQYLFEQGYTQISVFIDGYPGWKEAGYPIE